MIFRIFIRDAHDDIEWKSDDEMGMRGKGGDDGDGYYFAPRYGITMDKTCF